VPTFPIRKTYIYYVDTRDKMLDNKLSQKHKENCRLEKKNNLKKNGIKEQLYRSAALNGRN
jgi:hypothetical protein